MPEENVMVRKSLLFCVAVAALLAVSTVHEARAQGRRGGMMGPQGVSPVTVVEHKAVQKELGLSEEKAEKIKDIATDVREEMQQQVEGAGIDFRGLRDLSGDERAKRMVEIQAKMAEIAKNINDKFLPKLAEILDKAQMTRLHEIAIQAAGPEALRDASVAGALSLTKEQQDKIAAINKDFSAKRMQIPRTGEASERMAKMSELREEQTAKTAEVLTKDQQAKFAEMKGKPFDVKQLTQGGGRRGRRNNN
jgi:Spy/CpxP family protein refolding chaperone